MRARRGIGAAAALAGLSAAAAPAGVVFDGTIGPRAPLEALEPVGTQYQIKLADGAPSSDQANSNWFFSFQEFGIEDGRVGTFLEGENVPGPLPERLIARVTGSEPTGIFGMLRSSVGSADLFLLNPNGIVFGPKAEIDVPGSLYLSTADVLRFGEGKDLAIAVEPKDPILYSDAPWRFGFTSQRPAAITIDSSAIERPKNFAVSPGETISVTAGLVELDGERDLIAPSGSIELAATSSPRDLPVELESLAPEALGSSQGPPGGEPREGDVYLTAKAGLDVSGKEVGETAAGRIVIRGERFVLGASQLAANHWDPTTDAPATAIDVAASGSIELEKGSRINAVNAATPPGPPGSEGPAGPGISLRGGTIALSGHSTVSAKSTFGSPGGDIDLRADRTLGVSGDSVVSGETTSGGAAGFVEARAASVELSAGGRISSLTQGDGDAGGLLVVASDAVRAIGTGTGGEASGLFSRTEPGARGDAGPLSINARSLEIRDGARVSASSVNSGGNAGNLTVGSGDQPLERVELDGGSALVAQSTVILGDPTQRPVPDGEPGRSGALTIHADVLKVSGGSEINASTSGFEAPGEAETSPVTIDARVVEITGQGSGIFAKTITLDLDESDAAQVRDGGDLLVSASERLTVSAGGQLSTDSSGSGDAGDIWARAGSVEILDGGALRAISQRAGNAGSIRITADSSVQLARGGRIDVRNLGSGPTSLEAGDVVIDAGRRFESSGGSISTAAPLGAGGGIQIAARDEVVLVSGAGIESSVGGDFESSNAGDIRIGGPGAGAGVPAPRLAVVGISSSSIRANANSSRPGNILIDADQVVRSADSVIEAKTSVGVTGQIVITAPEQELVAQLATLPAEFLGASSLIASACEARTAPEGSFVVQRRETARAPADAALGWLGAGAPEVAGGLEGGECPSAEGTP